MFMGQIFNSLYLLAFFSLLHMSNLVPQRIGGFDQTRHLAMRDIFSCKSDVKILMKWTKTLSSENQASFLQFSCLGASPLYPVFALKHYLLSSW